MPSVTAADTAVRVVKPGDLLWLKRVSGPITVQARVGRVWYFELFGARQRTAVAARFGGRLAAPGWLRREIRQARYATFLRLNRVRPVPQRWIDKRDRRAWVVLSEPLEIAFSSRS